jgi:hypothetical protein
VGRISVFKGRPKFFPKKNFGSIKKVILNRTACLKILSAFLFPTNED